jgi:outer membrane protein assembly complex protein YaeT
MSSVRSRVLLVLLFSVVASAACREEGDIQISSITFEGVEQVDQSALANALQTKRGSRLPWGRKRFFDRRAFEADLKRIEAFYRDRGFPDARVASFDANLNETQDKVDVTLTISEGEPILVFAIEFTGFDVLSEPDLEALRETLPLQVGRPLDRQLALSSRERALNELRDRGYPYATVTVHDQDGGPRSRQVVLEANAGTLAHFGEIEINGQVSVSENVVRRQLTFQPGDLFTRQEMRESQRKLYGLELFEFVNVESREDTASQSPQVPIRITVAEGKHHKVNMGVGYGTEEHARARLRWDHLNFLGGARQLGLEGKWSSLDRGVRADYREPFFLSSHFSLNFEGQAWQAAEPVYSLNTVGGRIILRHQANSQNVWSISLINEYQRSVVEPEALEDLTLRDELIALGLDPTTGLSTGTLGALAFDISRNTTTNLLDARSGYLLSAHVEQAGRWLAGTWDYRSVSAEARHYLSAGRRAVFANRINVGTIDAVGEVVSNVPFYKRFFLGGASSMRGWGRFEVGPISGFGLPLGGHSMLEGSSEVRLPLMGKFSAVLFVDYGNVWSEPWDVNVRDLRYDVGPGLRYLTPIGPARVDFGYQLNPIDNLRVNGELEHRHWRVHFSVGQAF